MLGRSRPAISPTYASFADVSATREPARPLSSRAGGEAGFRLLGSPLVLTALVLVSAFATAGSGSGPLWWVGALLVVVAAVSAMASLLGFLEAPRLERAGIAFMTLFAALVVWSGASVFWSTAPDLSWGFLNRGLVYFAAITAGVLIGSREGGSSRPVTLALAGSFSVVLAAALATKVIPSLDRNLASVPSSLLTSARLSAPVDYANALALIGAFALPLALTLASEQRYLRVLRSAAVVVAFLACAVTPLTFSRGGIAIAVLVTVVWLVRSGRAFGGLVALGCAALPALAVGAVAFSLEGIVGEGARYSQRMHDGVIYGIALLAGTAGAYLLAWFALPRADRAREERQRALVRASLAAFVATVILAAGAIVVAAGGPRDTWRELSGSTPVTQETTRLGAVGSNYRLSWWKEALEGFRSRPLAGSGGETFELTHELHRTDFSTATEPHSLPLQLASELGLVGLLLGIAAAAAAWRAIRRHLRSATAEEHPAELALALVILAYLAHSLVDFPWEHPASSVPAALVAGVLIARPSRKGRSHLTFALAAFVLALASLYSLAAPWLSDRAVDRSIAASETNLDTARRAARDARRWNPLSLEALYAEASALQQLGDTAGAGRLYLRATEMQPENAFTWTSLGYFEWNVLHDPCRAYDRFNRAYTFDSRGSVGVGGGPLDRTRMIRNSGVCG